MFKQESLYDYIARVNLKCMPLFTDRGSVWECSAIFCLGRNYTVEGDGIEKAVYDSGGRLCGQIKLDLDVCPIKNEESSVDTCAVYFITLSSTRRTERDLEEYRKINAS